MKRILYVDDDPAILDSSKQILELEGYEIDTALTGEEALLKIENDFFHLAIFDIKLPDMEGTELLVKAHKLRPGMKKIMVTGYASLDNSVFSLNAGADGYLMKPVNPKDLIEKIKEKLNEQEKEAELDGEKVAEFLEERLLSLK